MKNDLRDMFNEYEKNISEETERNEHNKRLFNTIRIELMSRQVQALMDITKAITGISEQLGKANNGQNGGRDGQNIGQTNDLG